MSPSIIRWGILGTGKISSKFARALKYLPDAELVAVGSRTVEKAEAFGAEYDIPHRHGSYEALAADAAVDVVYVGTPHVLHRENTLLCLEAGKAVLCEKPFTLNTAEADEVIGVARRRGLFLMEAMWTRYFPLVQRVREIVGSGRLGEVLLFSADFGFRAEFGPEHRLFNPTLGGGALLDIGIYPVSLASMLWGAPERVASLAHLGPTGVDEQAGIVMGYEGGRLAVLYTSVRVDTPIEAMIMGTRGRLRLHRRMHQPTRLTLTLDGEPEETVEMPIEGNGMNYEAAEVMRCLREGLTESPTMPLDETRSILRTLDLLRAQWGLRYPSEE